MRETLRPALKGLSTALSIMAIMSGLVALLGVGVAVFDGDPAGFMAVIAGVSGIIACLLGRVLVYIAATLDDIAFVVGAPRNARLWPLRDQIANPARPPV